MVQYGLDSANPQLKQTAEQLRHLFGPNKYQHVEKHVELYVSAREDLKVYYKFKEEHGDYPHYQVAMKYLTSRQYET